MVTVKAQCEACTIVVQVGGPWQAGGAGWERFLSGTLPPVLTGWLQTLAQGFLPALLPWWALGIQSIGLAGQQTGLPSTPHLGGDTPRRDPWQWGTTGRYRQHMKIRHGRLSESPVSPPPGGPREAGKTPLQRGLSVKAVKSWAEPGTGVNFPKCTGREAGPRALPVYPLG